MKQKVGLFSSGALVLATILAGQPACADDQQATAATVMPNPAGSDNGLYKVVGGDQVDASTLKGWKTWRSMACERCHGAAQEGMVGPSLVQSLKVLTKDEFKTVVMNGRIDKGMPNFGGSASMVENIDNLYAYLKGRSDGAIKPGHLKGIE